MVAVGLAVGGINGTGARTRTARGRCRRNDSQGQAQAIFHLSEDGDSMDFKLNVVEHRRRDAVAYPLRRSPASTGRSWCSCTASDPAGVDPHGRLNEGTITDARRDRRGLASAACPGGVANLADVIEKMNNGGAYVNVHTLASSAGGEIRGDIK